MPCAMPSAVLLVFSGLRMLDRKNRITPSSEYTMKRSPSFILLFFLATFTIVSSSPASDTTSDTSLTTASTLETSPNTTPSPTPDAPERCRDQGVYSIRAIRIILILALVSSLHMPGSLVYQKRPRFHRLVPEVGLIDLFPTLIALIQSTIIHKRPFRQAVAAVLICRYCTSKEDPWWEKPECNDDDQATPTTTFGGGQSLQDALDHLQTFGPARFLYITLSVTAIIQAFTTKTSLEVTLEVVTYSIPLFTLELISLAALRLNPPRSTLERNQEIFSCAKLITEIKQPIPSTNQEPLRQRFYHVSHNVLLLVIGIPAALHLFYPFSIPGFILLTFSEWHSANGHWYISWLTWVGWLVCLGGVILSLFIVSRLPAWIMARPFPDLCTRYCEGRDRIVAAFMDHVLSERPSHVFLVDLYTVLKIIVLVRHFVL